jgi:uncharacterized coiled-coil protein SlyX
MSPVDSLIKLEEQQAATEDRQAEIEDNLFDLRQDIALKRQELQALQDKLDFYQQRKELVEKEVKLNVETIGRLKNIEDEIFDIKSNIEAVNRELPWAYQRRGRIQDVMAGISQSGIDDEEDEPTTNRTQVYRSPVEGKVNNIFKEPLELALKSEKIIFIQRDSAKVLAEVIFDREDSSSLPIGTELNMRFDNGEPSRGIITDLYIAGVGLDPVSNLTNIEESEKIVVELKPANEKVRKQWRLLNGMGIKASKSIF